MSGVLESGVLESSGLTVRYAGNVALSEIDISVPAGTMVGLVGANGAGKSTLVNALAGWSRGRATVTGTIRLGGSDIAGLAAHQRVAQGLTLVPEGKNIFMELTVDENLLQFHRRQIAPIGSHSRSLKSSSSSPALRSAAVTRARHSRAANARCSPSAARCSPGHVC